MTFEPTDKPTVPIRRDELLGLVAQSVASDGEDGISPVAILVVIAMFIGLFIAIVQIS